MNSNVLKWIGIVDGIVGAGAALVAQAFGTADPTVATWCHIIIAVVGVVGTTLGVAANSSSSS